MQALLMPNSGDASPRCHNNGMRGLFRSKSGYFFGLGLWTVVCGLLVAATFLGGMLVAHDCTARSSYQVRPGIQNLKHQESNSNKVRKKQSGPLIRMYCHVADHNL